MTEVTEADPGAASRVPPIGGARLLAWAAIAVIGIDIVFFTGASNFLASPQARILNQALMLGSIVALAWFGRRGALDLRSPLILPGFALLAATVVATLTSERPATSREALALVLLAAPTYLVVRTITWTDWLRSRLDGLVVGATVVFVIAYLAQAGLQWLRWWSVAGPSMPPLRPGDVGLTIGTVNAVALYLELLVPLATALAWTTLRRPRLAVFVAAIGIVALVITGSRGAWLGAAAAAGVTGVVAWLLSGRPMPRMARGRGRIAVVVAGIAVVVAGAVLAPVVASRLLAGDAGRIELWSAAWSMFTSSPVSGTGPGTFPLLRPLTPITSASYAVLTTSHNSVLQTLTDTGLLGLAAVGWIVLVVGRLGVRAIREPGPGATRAVAVAVVGSLLAMALHSIVDTQFHIPGVVALTFVLIARLDRPDRAAAAVAPAPRAVASAGLVAVAAAVVLLVPVDLAMVQAAQANAALDRGDATAAAALYRSAAGLHELGPYRLGEGLAASQLDDSTGARAAFDRAVALHPLTFLQANLAAAEDAGARRTILDAIEAQNDYDPAALVNAAAMRYPDDVDRAVDDLAAAMADVPTLVFSERPPSLFDDATWAAAQAEAVERIGASDPATAAAVATIAGMDAAAAPDREAVTDPLVQEALALLDASVHGEADGIGRGRELLREAPGSQILHRVLWLLAFQAKSQLLVDEIAAVAITAYFGLPDPPMELVVDGRLDADWAWRLPRYPMASDFRNGPSRQYADGMVTIEPVHRPQD